MSHERRIILRNIVNNLAKVLFYYFYHSDVKLYLIKITIIVLSRSYGSYMYNLFIDSFVAVDYCHY